MKVCGVGEQSKATRCGKKAEGRCTEVVTHAVGLKESGRVHEFKRVEDRHLRQGVKCA